MSNSRAPKGGGMSRWTKFVILAAAMLMIGAGATLVAQAAGSNRSPGVVDISGPCDEAEHANDPRCKGASAPAKGDDDLSFDFDISGPCDEAEHANDPRCTGVGGVEDNSGPGNGHEDGEDNSGPSENSGHGNNGDDGDDEDHGDDDSGRGGGNDDQGGNSGPGGGDD
jgi:hypothetical protein